MLCATTILSTEDRFRRRRIFNMDALVCQQAQAELFANSPILQVYCCDLRVQFGFSIPSLPFIRMKGLFCHFSFMDTLSERRGVIIPHSQPLLNKLDAVNSPCIITVKSSVCFKVRRFYVCYTLQLYYSRVCGVLFNHVKLEITNRDFSRRL